MILKEGRAVQFHFQNGLLYPQQRLPESTARGRQQESARPTAATAGNAPGPISLLMPHFSRTPPLTRSFLRLSVRPTVRPSFHVHPMKNDDSRRRRFFLSRRLSACACVRAPWSAARTRRPGNTAVACDEQGKRRRRRQRRHRWARWSHEITYRPSEREPSTTNEGIQTV